MVIGVSSALGVIPGFEFGQVDFFGEDGVFDVFRLGFVEQDLPLDLELFGLDDVERDVGRKIVPDALAVDVVGELVGGAGFEFDGSDGGHYFLKRLIINVINITIPAITRRATVMAIDKATRNSTNLAIKNRISFNSIRLNSIHLRSYCCKSAMMSGLNSGNFSRSSKICLSMP